MPQTAAQSSYSETAVDLGKVIGTVRVIVENNTADTGAADTGYGTWEAGAAKWHGKLVHKEVTLYENSTAMTCITDAVGDYSMTDSDGYITEIAGLKADAQLAKLSAPLGSVARAETYHAEDNTVTLTLYTESGTKETTLPLTTDILGEWFTNV